MKEVDDTPVPKGESEQMFEHVSAAVDKLNELLSAKIVKLEKEVALLLEQRETVRAPECEEDPEWY